MSSMIPLTLASCGKGKSARMNSPDVGGGASPMILGLILTIDLGEKGLGRVMRNQRRDTGIYRIQ